LTERRTGGESRYVLRRRSEAHSGHRTGWGGPLLRGNHPKGRMGPARVE
jgi:hypothetical protein